MSEDDEAERAKWSCDAMRKKIATFLATKEMTQTAWLREISVNAGSTTIS